MKFIKIAAFTLTLLFVTCLESFSQVPGFPNKKLLEGTIENQFLELNNISRNQDQHKLIRRANLDQVRANVADTLSVYKKELHDLKEQFKEHETLKSSLQDSIGMLNTKIKEYENSQNTIGFLGTEFSKTSYNVVVWSLIIVLLLIVFILFQRLISLNMTTKEAKTRVNEIQEEFDKHRKKALEKEQKLMRQLQDEINKKGHF